MSKVKFVVPQDCYLNHKVQEVLGHDEVLFCIDCSQLFDIRKFPPFYYNN